MKRLAQKLKRKMPWKKDADTGELVLVTKSKYRPKFADSQGQLISENNVPPIYGGSTLKLAGNIYPYTSRWQCGCFTAAGWRSNNRTVRRLRWRHLI